MIKKEMMRIVHNRRLAPSIYEMVLEGELVAEITEPGQFIHIKTSHGDEPLLRRPISIADHNLAKSQMTIIYRATGMGTILLGNKLVGEQLDVLGPLGNGFPVEEVESEQTAVLIGGGIGVPPLYLLSKQLKAKGVRVIHILGFQTASAIFYHEKFSLLGETYITTVDGSMGTKGLVTDCLTKLNKPIDCIYACGPNPMLRALEGQSEGHKMFISFEERMGCGIGACFACVCHLANDPTGTSYKKVCKDGPVFRAGEIII